jgi:AcrR family transcriptional regulator
MSPRRKEDFEAIREQSRKHIMEVAFAQFGDNGYHQTSMATIAQKAGISKGLIYNYFDSKEQLLVELVKDAFNTIEVHFPYIKDPPRMKPAALLERYIHDTMEMLIAVPGFWRLIYSLLLQPQVSKLVAPMLQEYFKDYMPVFIDIFRSFGAENPELAAAVFNAHLDGIALGYIAAGPMFNPKVVENQLLEIYIPKRLRKK